MHIEVKQYKRVYWREKIYFAENGQLYVHGIINEFTQREREIPM